MKRGAWMRGRMGARGRAALAVWAAALPRLAWACPMCATRDDATGAVGWVLAAMICAPLAVGLGVFFVARRLERAR